MSHRLVFIGLTDQLTATFHACLTPTRQQRRTHSLSARPSPCLLCPLFLTLWALITPASTSDECHARQRRCDQMSGVSRFFTDSLCSDHLHGQNFQFVPCLSSGNLYIHQIPANPSHLFYFLGAEIKKMYAGHTLKIHRREHLNVILRR